MYPGQPEIKKKLFFVIFSIAVLKQFQYQKPKALTRHQLTMHVISHEIRNKLFLFRAMI